MTLVSTRPDGRADALKTWAVRALLLLLLTALWGLVYGLWISRGAHMGLEWFLEGLIVLVALRFPVVPCLAAGGLTLWLIGQIRKIHCVRS